MTTWIIRIYGTGTSGAHAMNVRNAFGTRAEACEWASRTLGPGPWEAVQLDDCPTLPVPVDPAAAYAAAAARNATRRAQEQSERCAEWCAAHYPCARGGCCHG